MSSIIDWFFHKNHRKEILTGSPSLSATSLHLLLIIGSSSCFFLSDRIQTSDYEHRKGHYRMPARLWPKLATSYTHGWSLLWHSTIYRRNASLLPVFSDLSHPLAEAVSTSSLHCSPNCLNVNSGGDGIFHGDKQSTDGTDYFDGNCPAQLLIFSFLGAIQDITLCWNFIQYYWETRFLASLYIR